MSGLDSGMGIQRRRMNGCRSMEDGLNDGWRMQFCALTLNPRIGDGRRREWIAERWGEGREAGKGTRQTNILRCDPDSMFLSSVGCSQGRELLILQLESAA